MTKNKFRSFKPIDENGLQCQEKNPHMQETEKNSRMNGEKENPYGNDREENAVNGEKKPFWKRNGAEPAESSADDDRQQYFSERMIFLAEKTLFNEGLPTTFAQMLCGDTEEETLENIAIFKEQYEKSVETAVSEKMKGFTPKTNSGMTAYDPFLAGLNG